MKFSGKERIEREFGPLWSGADTIAVGARVFTIRELKRAMDLAGDDLIGIDLHAMPEGRFAFRFYDGDDRCIVVFVMDEELDIVREMRAHIAEWLEDEYYASGMEAFLAKRMVGLLRRKVTEEPPES